MSVVNASALAEVATDLDIGHYLLLGRGEDAAASAVADACVACLEPKPVGGAA